MKTLAKMTPPCLSTAKLPISFGVRSRRKAKHPPQEKPQTTRPRSPIPANNSALASP